MFCSKCGAEMAKDAKFCSKCGTSVNSAYLCPDCNKEIALDDVFCPFCGYKIIKSDETEYPTGNLNIPIREDLTIVILP